MIAGNAPPFCSSLTPFAVQCDPSTCVRQHLTPLGLEAGGAKLSKVVSHHSLSPITYHSLALFCPGPTGRHQGNRDPHGRLQRTLKTYTDLGRTRGWLGSRRGAHLRPPLAPSGAAVCGGGLCCRASGRQQRSSSYREWGEGEGGGGKAA